MESTTFRVLVVCTANRCRSPIAEHVLRSEFAQLCGSAQADWSIQSVGIRAEPGLPIHPRAAAALRKRAGIDASAFRSRRINKEAIASADLILTASREHRAAVVTLVPGAIRYTFTIRQFAHLATGVKALGNVDLSPSWGVAAAGHVLVEEALGSRSELQPLDPVLEDVADPMGHRQAAYRRCTDQIARAVSAILAPLAGALDQDTRRLASSEPS